MNFTRAFLAFGCLVFLLSSCGRETPFFQAGTSREEVRRLMGEASNEDDQIIAVWSLAKTHQGKPWREIFDAGTDGWFAVFDADNRTLLPRLSFSASTINSKMSDQEVLAWARQLKAEGWGQ